MKTIKLTVSIFDVKGSADMPKRILCYILALLCLSAGIAACREADEPNGENSDTEVSTEQSMEMTTEKPGPDPLPYLIPYPDRIHLASLDAAVFKAAFTRGTATTIKQTEGGLETYAKSESRDPGICWDVNSMYKAAGYPVDEQSGNYVPFTPEEKRVIVFKLQAEWGGAFEMYYATNERHAAKGKYAITEIYGGDSEFFGDRVWQYVIFEATEDTEDWCVRFNDGFRLDYSNFVQKGDSILIEQIAFCADRAEAEAYIAEDRGEIPPVPEVAAGYYVCLYEDRLHLPKDNVKGEVYATLEEAKEACDKYMKYGYRVANEKGEIVYTPYSLLQTNLLREGYYIVNYARVEKFKYGDSCTNPGINHRPHYTSCDRLVDWILYRAGFTDQPLVQGKVVTNLPEWCEAMGFEKITREQDLQAGDIIFVRPSSKGLPLHTFMLASDYKDGSALRYDHGSDTRIMNKKQPTKEPISYGDAPFMYAYRPVVTEENNIYYHDLYADQDQ